MNSYLRCCYELKPWKASEGGTIPRLYNDNIAKAVIAVPPIEEQKRIVSILDRFDAICNDLTSGLPQRWKQDKSSMNIIEINC